MIPTTSLNSAKTAAAVVPALQRASAATGVDFTYLLEQARTESSLNPKAQAGTSSARGLFQFLDSTWLDVVDRHGEKHGLNTAAASISRDSRGRPVVHDAAQRAAILQLRDDPYISGLMAGELARDNAAALKQQLGREARPAELYMAHFLGAGGAATFLGELQENPGLKASQIVPAAARANQSVFFKGGRALSLDEVFARFEGKFSGAEQPLTARMQDSMPRRPAAANTRPDAANFAARTALLAARKTLQPGTGDTGAGNPAPAHSPSHAPSHYASRSATPTPPATALLALQMLQSITLPGEDEPHVQRTWRA